MLVALCCLAVVRDGGAQTVGTLVHTAGSLDNGYVLFAPMLSDTTYMVDKCGRRMHQWPSDNPTTEAAYLRADGSIVRIVDKAVERIAWDGQRVWKLSSPLVSTIHHDVELLPNGNLLVLCFDLRSAAEAIDAGIAQIDPLGQVASETIYELRPVGADSAEVIWQWKAWDHLVQDRVPGKGNFGTVADHPELIDLNYPSGFPNDLLHFNSVRYNEALDQILVSCHNYGEIWIIDHSTSTSEAATHAGGRRGHGGDLLYRWGNPLAYGHGAATDQQLFGQHDARWIPNEFPHGGGIMVFNNGLGRPLGQYSSVDIIMPSVDRDGNYTVSSLPMLPATPVWTYTAAPPTLLYAPSSGGAQMLPNGNVLISYGVQGEFWEIDSTSRLVWKYVNPINDAGTIIQGRPPLRNRIFKGMFYPATDPGLSAHVIVAGPTLEAEPAEPGCTLNTDTTSVVAGNAAVPTDALSVYPNPARDVVTVGTGAVAPSMNLYNALGTCVAAATHTRSLSTAGLPSGAYCLIVHEAFTVRLHTITIVK